MPNLVPSEKLLEGKAFQHGATFTCKKPKRGARQGPKFIKGEERRGRENCWKEMGRGERERKGRNTGN